jgi:predicted amidohydrolase
VSSRITRVAAAQLGPIQRSESRAEVVQRLIALLKQASSEGAELVVFPELALTTFFPRWWVDDLRQADHFYETALPGPETQPLFDTAFALGCGFALGYAERVLDETGETTHRYNSMILVERDGSVVANYRKVHIPGHSEHEPSRAFQHAERHYFESGDTGFTVHRAFNGIVGMALCNDRRWPETYRVMGLQGVEMVLIGYNTPLQYLPDPTQDRLAGFHNSLVMQSGAYQNGTWVIGVAKAGMEEGCDLLAESQIIAPSGEVVAMTTTNADEVILADCDLDWCSNYKRTLFDFERYREIQHYGLISSQRGVVEPPLVNPASPPRGA